jgi:hypothetical protein
MYTHRELQSLFQDGKNISQVLRESRGLSQNTDTIIETAYDLQTGNYIAAMGNEKMVKHKFEYTEELTKIIKDLCEPQSILEAGIGEGITIPGVLKNLDKNIKSYGFDISWSRIAFARQWLAKNNIHPTSLCTGNLFDIPFADNSIDVVYTSHSIEPNGGSESEILKELYRVTRKYLILLEPGYELASDEAKLRMDSHGYCKDLSGISEGLGFKVKRHELFPHSYTELNPTAITIIEKNTECEPSPHVYACPIYKTKLEVIGGALYSPEALTVYPIIDGIPCLRIENGILASKFKEVIDS